MEKMKLLYVKNLIIALSVGCFVATNTNSTLGNWQRRIRIDKVGLNLYTVIPTKSANQPGMPFVTFEKRLDNPKLLSDEAAVSMGNTQEPCIMQVCRGLVDVTQTDRIIILSRGYIPPRPWGTLSRHSGGLRSVNWFLRYGIATNMVWVAFDYEDNRKRVNFGQKADIDRLAWVIDRVNQLNPQAKITLIGDCRGAHTILKYLASTYASDVVDTAILESPYESVRSVVAFWTHNTVGALIASPVSRLLQVAFNQFFPNYDATKDCLCTMLSMIKGKQILVGHCAHDRLIQRSDIVTIVEELSKNNSVYFYESHYPGTEHSCLCPDPYYRAMLANFFEQYDMQMAKA